ncbi:MAG: hypothetical protein ACLVEA_02550 [Acidaminococcus intestini]|jgi:hypothetical protein
MKGAVTCGPQKAALGLTRKNPHNILLEAYETLLYVIDIINET